MPPPKLYPDVMRACFRAGTFDRIEVVRGSLDRTEWVRQAVAEKLAREGGGRTPRQPNCSRPSGNPLGTAQPAKVVDTNTPAPPSERMQNIIAMIEAESSP